MCARCCNGGFWEHLIFIEQKSRISSWYEIKKSYRRQEGKYIEKILKIQNDVWCKNYFWVFDSIFYKHNVVGNNIYFMCTKMGVRTSLFLTSQHMPSRYGCACERIQSENYLHGKYLLMKFLTRNFISTELLVMFQIQWTSNMAAQRSAPLRSGGHTMMGEIYIVKIL